MRIESVISQNDALGDDRDLDLAAILDEDAEAAQTGFGIGLAAPDAHGVAELVALVPDGLVLGALREIVGWPSTPDLDRLRGVVATTHARQLLPQALAGLLGAAAAAGVPVLIAVDDAEAVRDPSAVGARARAEVSRAVPGADVTVTVLGSSRISGPSIAEAVGSWTAAICAVPAARVEDRLARRRSTDLKAHVRGRLNAARDDAEDARRHATTVAASAQAVAAVACGRAGLWSETADRVAREIDAIDRGPLDAALVGLTPVANHRKAVRAAIADAVAKAFPEHAAFDLAQAILRDVEQRRAGTGRDVGLGDDFPSIAEAFDRLARRIEADLETVPAACYAPVEEVYDGMFSTLDGLVSPGSSAHAVWESIRRMPDAVRRRQLESASQRALELASRAARNRIERSAEGWVRATAEEVERAWAPLAERSAAQVREATERLEVLERSLRAMESA